MPLDFTWPTPGKQHEFEGNSSRKRSGANWCARVHPSLEAFFGMSIHHGVPHELHWDSRSIGPIPLFLKR